MHFIRRYYTQKDCDFLLPQSGRIVTIPGGVKVVYEHCPLIGDLFVLSADSPLPEELRGDPEAEEFQRRIGFSFAPCEVFHVDVPQDEEDPCTQ